MAITDQNLTDEAVQSIVGKLVVLVIAILIAFPFYWMIVTAIKTTGGLSQYPPTLIPDTLSLEQFRRALQAGSWGQWFTNTVIITVATTVSVLLVSTPAAYALARKEFFGKRIIFVGIISGLFIPSQIILIPLFVMFSRSNMTNTYIGLTLVYTVLFTGFATFFMWSFFKSLPDNLEDAAQIAGISHWKTFSRIIIPLSKPGIATSGVFVFVFTWNEYLWALVFMRDSSKYTISIGLTFFEGLHGTIVFGQLMAISILVILPVLLFFAMTQERFINGITPEF